jgi:hypothetical protein
VTRGSSAAFGQALERFRNDLGALPAPLGKVAPGYLEWGVLGPDAVSGEFRIARRFADLCALRRRVPGLDPGLLWGELWDRIWGLVGQVQGIANQVDPVRKALVASSGRDTARLLERTQVYRNEVQSSQKALEELSRILKDAPRELAFEARVRRLCTATWALCAWIQNRRFEDLQMKARALEGKDMLAVRAGLTAV